ncbi:MULTISPECIES: hypothetical protein [Enterobacter]|jgi:hypothetical protein|nr:MULTISPECIES: hypothetical protein [Enterobacter]
MKAKHMNISNERSQDRNNGKENEKGKDRNNDEQDKKSAKRDRK